VYGAVPPDALDVKLTARGAWPLVGFPEAVTLKEVTVVTEMETVALAVWLAASVTDTSAV
jgi:hypothetical protein